jgi:EF hand
MKTKLAFLMTCLMAGGTMFGAPPPKKPVPAPAPAAPRGEPPVFRVADRNNDGRVGPEEFAIADPGPGAFGRWDTNKNGFLSPPEYAAYVAATTPPKPAPPPPPAREAPPFRIADKNNDGRVGPEEFAIADPGKGAFGRWDTNKNGFLSPPEYAAYLAANRGPGGPRP